MATRPAWRTVNGKIEKRNFEFVFNAGFSATQKKKNVKALHEAINKKTLEISTKSDEKLGNALSAFNLKLNGIPFECVFQAAKKYEKGGPYLDLLKKTPKEAKLDERHKTSGKLIGFVCNGESFPLEPKTLFYDYMYIKAVKESIPKEDIVKLLDYEYFTDIEFNPNRSINCQARSIAIIKAMLERFGDIPELNLKDFTLFHNLVEAGKA